MEFSCDCCGICCKNISQIPQLREFDNGSGACINLTKDNKCAIYATRPEICDIEAMYKKHYYRFYTKNEFYRINNNACAALKARFGD